MSKDNPFYKDLPGMSVIIGGLWIANLSYFGCNQYIIQRALAARSISRQVGMKSTQLLPIELFSGLALRSVQ